MYIFGYLLSLAPRPVQALILQIYRRNCALSLGAHQEPRKTCIDPCLLSPPMQALRAKSRVVNKGTLELRLSNKAGA